METKKQTNGTKQHKPVRLWLGVVIVLLMWLLRYGLPMLIPGDLLLEIGIFSELVWVTTFVIWWLFFSKALLIDRIGGILLIIVALVATSFLIDKSIATSNMGLMFVIYSIPVMCLAFITWVFASRQFAALQRRITMAITMYSLQIMDIPQDQWYGRRGSP